MARQCPPLTNLTENPQLILIGNVGIPRLSTYERTVNTKVDLTCASGYRLQPNNPQLVCQDSLQWDKANPVCTNTPLPTTTTASPSPLSDDQTLIIAITGGIGGFIFIILVVLIAAICRMQRRAQKRRKAHEISPAPRTEMTSAAGSLYALDNRVYGHDKSYPLYPPSYSSRDIDQGKVGYGNNSIALPPPSFVHNAYSNRGYDRTDESQFMSPRSREDYGYHERRGPDTGVAMERSRDPQDYPETRIPDEVPRNRDEILETLARERFDQLQHDRARFQSLDAVYDPSRRGRVARAGEAKVRAERTIQYVEEHGSRSATPSFGGPRDMPGVHQGAITRQGPASYDGAVPSRYLDDYRTHGHTRDNLEQQRYQRHPDDNRLPLDPRVADQDYGQYAGGPIGHSPNVYDSFDRTGYELRAAPQSAELWRPQTKTHYTEKRRR